MNLIFTEGSWSDYLWFQATERTLLKKIKTLINVTDVTQSISKSQNQLQGLFLRKDKAQPKRDRACVLLIFGSLVRNISE